MSQMAQNRITRNIRANMSTLNFIACNIWLSLNINRGLVILNNIISFTCLYSDNSIKSNILMPFGQYILALYCGIGKVQ